MLIRGPTAAADGGGLRARRRLSRALKEFAAVPLLIILGFVLLAVLSILTDQSHLPLLRVLRHAFERVIGDQAATNTLQAIATGLMTVTSITFSVLLLAVQQTATSLSPVVFDQFVRRRANQVLLGLFLGLTLYAYVLLVAVRKDTPPVLGAGLGTLLTVGALGCLLVLIYLTVDQMRPDSVLRQIHNRTLRGRSQELQIIRRTRREEQSNDPVSATCWSHTMGYVVGIDLARLAESLTSVPNAEIRLWVTLGQPVAYGDKIATVRDDDCERAARLADEVPGAILIDAQPDPDLDATTGIDEIGNIAWTSASTAKHNPETARYALHVLRDLIARWIDEPCPTDEDPPLPVVYPDQDLDRALDVLYSMLGAAHESQQHQTATRVLATYRELISRATGAVAARMVADLTLARRLVSEIPPSPALDRERRWLDAESRPDNHAQTEDGDQPYDRRESKEH